MRISQPGVAPRTTERHRNPMVVKTLDPAGQRRIAAFDLEAVGEFLGADPDPAQVRRERREPVRLLHPEFPGSGNA